MAIVGIGYRRELGRWINSHPAGVNCLEITAEHFFDGTKPLLSLAKQFPLFVHGLGLSLGTPGPLDKKTLDSFTAVVEAAAPKWISDHIAFTRSDEVDLGHLNPLQPTREALRIVADHTRELSERCRKPVILENITSHLRLQGEMSEAEFLNRLCEEARCGLLLDVTNLFINSRNHRFDPAEWLKQIDPKRIVQLHVVGYSLRDGRYEDEHVEPIQDDLLELTQRVLEYADVEAVILERDGNYGALAEIAADLARLEKLCAAS